MKYQVGQILYVVLRKEMRVYPMQVTQEITKRTLEGEETSYVVRGGSDPKAQLLISDIDGEVFDSAEKAKTMLIDRATGNIVKLVDTAVQKAREWYPNSFEAPGDDPITLLKKPSTSSTSPPPLPSKRMHHDPVAELAAELQRESVQLTGDDAILSLPDGKKAKVRSVKLPEPQKQ